MPASKPPSRLVVVAAIAGAHGVRGDVRVKSFTAEPEACFAYGPLLDDTGVEVLRAAAIRPGPQALVVTPVRPRSREDWEAMKGRRLHVPRAALPEPDEDEFYIEDLVGLSVFAGGHAPVGTVRAIQDFGAGDLIEVMLADGRRSVFVPFTRADVPVVDLAAGRLVVADWETWSDPGRDAP